MPQLIYKKRKYPIVELGDLIHKIDIYDRSIVAPNNTGNYSIDFKKKIAVWAMIETSAGEVIFDSISMEKVITHKIIIRYLPFLTQEYWINYDNESYDIVSIEDINKEKRFQILYCNVRGSLSKQASEA